MGCSCPDEAIPCKHLAAVIYTIANEIDRNPFLVFQLKGLDILAEIQKVQVDGIEQCIWIQFCPSKTSAPMSCPTTKTGDRMKKHGPTWTLPPFRHWPISFLDLLSTDVTFTKGDFHKSLARAYKLFSKPADTGKTLVAKDRPSIRGSGFQR